MLSSVRHKTLPVSGAYPGNVGGMDTAVSEKDDLQRFPE
jgi:hypothetical protein